jgi:hypothetical protein
MLYMGPIKFISKVLPAASEAEMKFINGFPISTHLSGPDSYELHLSILAYYYSISSSSSPQGERVYTPYIKLLF